MGRPVTVVALLLAFVALGVAGWLTRYPDTFRSSGQSFTAEQEAQAKTTACQAFDTVSKGVFENTNRPNPVAPDDVTGSMVVAANAKIALFDGGRYLHARLDPATPAELTSAMKLFGDALMDIGAAANAGVVDGDRSQAARFADADALNSRLRGICA